MTPTEWDQRIITVTMCSFVFVVTGAMVYGLFSVLVDNKMIFALIAPPFSGVFGYFMGKRK